MGRTLFVAATGSGTLDGNLTKLANMRPIPMTKNSDRPDVPQE